MPVRWRPTGRVQGHADVEVVALPMSMGDRKGTKDSDLALVGVQLSVEAHCYPSWSPALGFAATI